MSKTYRAIFLQITKADIQDAYDWYESKQVGLGDKFLDDLEDCKNSICSFPLKY